MRTEVVPQKGGGQESSVGPGLGVQLDGEHWGAEKEPWRLGKEARVSWCWRGPEHATGLKDCSELKTF